jgi:hypothetical protein
MSVISLEEWRKKQEDISASQSQSKQNTQSDAHGPKPIDEAEVEVMLEIYTVLLQAKQSPFTTKSDFARVAANPIALAASEGLISTRLNEDTFTNRWMVTAEGMEWMEGMEDVLSTRQ